MKMSSLRLIQCDEEHAKDIASILNDAIEKTCDIYDCSPRSVETVREWIVARHKSDLPVIAVVDDEDVVRAFGSYSIFRPFEAYQTTVEHSIYVASPYRRRGLGRWLLSQLVEEARLQNKHCMIAGIDSQNSASIQMHLQFGFEECGEMRQVARKFNRWLDLLFFQYFITESRLKVFRTLEI